MPGSGESKASAHSDAVIRTSPHGGLDEVRLRGRLLVERHGRLDRLDHPQVGLERGDLRVAPRARAADLGHQVADGARLHAFLPEARQHVADVGEVGRVRAHEEHATAPVPQPRIGVEEVGRAVQRDDRLAGAGTTVDDQCPTRPGPDDGVLVGLDGAQHVAHPGRTAPAEGGDERRLVVERRGVGQSLVGERLVPVVDDPAAHPAVATPAHQALRVCVGGGEERLGGRRAPVDEQPAAVGVGESEPSDVRRPRPGPRGRCDRGRGRGRSGAGLAAGRSAGAPPGRARGRPCRGAPRCAAPPPAARSRSAMARSSPVAIRAKCSLSRSIRDGSDLAARVRGRAKGAMSGEGSVVGSVVVGVLLRHAVQCGT